MLVGIIEYFNSQSFVHYRAYNKRIIHILKYLQSENIQNNPKGKTYLQAVRVS
jgi:hypothetical protein